MDYIETHTNLAKALYRQRLGWMQAQRIGIQGMLSLEYRLRVHLHVLASQISASEQEPDELPDAFVYLAVRFSSNAEHQQQASDLACQWLQERGVRSQAARDALLLFPSAVTYEAMREVYREHETLRPILIYILSQHGARLPQPLTQQVEQETDPFLQAQILHYAANEKDNNIDRFEPYYQCLIDDNVEQLHNHHCLVAAIWAGLVRQQSKAREALRKAIDQESNAIQRLDFLRLAALTGDQEYYPLLKDLIEPVPELGFHFLALHGHSHAVSDILDGLSHPRTAMYADDAWWWVSGQILPKKPRLSVVGEQPDHAQVEDEIGFVPDVQLAKQWWSKQEKHQDMRWLQGRNLTIYTVSDMLQQYTGLISNDLFDLFALVRQQPIQLGHYTWHDQRLRKINQFIQAADTDQTSNPVLRHA